MRGAQWVVVCGCLAFAAGCGDGGVVPDDAATGGADAFRVDVGSVDGGGVVDAFAVDAPGPMVDANRVDAATRDAGSADANAPDANAPDAAVPPADTGVPPAFTLTSPAYPEGGVIPNVHTCAGANTSPQLDWVNPPVGTLSFAVFFKDQTTAFRHSAIYDIPSTRTGLPADVDMTAMPADVPGARQPRGYPGTPGYAGPCPGATHTYRFTLYAIDVATLPGLTAGSSLAAVETAFMAHLHDGL